MIVAYSALLSHTVLPQEVIVIDNASSDASVEIARRYASARVLKQSENLGFARGINVAIQVSAGESEWSALFNPDAFSDLQWLEALLPAAIEYPTVNVFLARQIGETT
ncbi:MAG TPA: glycosyltransferase [Nitrospira sp.]|nr:glycosyltransferase [Nitrospira sp.]